jgi:hypothetical protein
MMAVRARRHTHDSGPPPQAVTSKPFLIGKTRFITTTRGFRAFLPCFATVVASDPELRSFTADNMPDPVHLNKGANTTLALVSRAPFDAIEQFRKRMGWTLPWYSSAGSDFNYDFHVSSDEAIAPVQYNYKDKQTLEREGLAFYVQDGSDQHDVSVFARSGDQVFSATYQGTADPAQAPAFSRQASAFLCQLRGPQAMA